MIIFKSVNTKRVVITVGIGAAISLLVGFYYSSEHFMTQRVDDFVGSEAERDRAFSEDFPSRHDVEDYYSDATILMSDPPTENMILFFRKDGRLFTWHGRDLDSGNGSITPLVKRRIYKGKQRFDVEYSLCMAFDDGSLKEDNCFLMADKDRMFMFNLGPVEHAEGDLFQLSTRKKAPFNLPSTQISIERIKNALNAR